VQCFFLADHFNTFFIVFDQGSLNRIHISSIVNLTGN